MAAFQSVSILLLVLLLFHAQILFVKADCDVGYARGWTLVCYDIDECSKGTHNCTLPFEECQNNDGSFKCICTDGYTRDSSSDLCTQVVTTATKTTTTAINDNSCGNGYERSFFGCRDIDECKRRIDTCSKPYEKCLNTDGSFECVCSDGYTRGLESHDCTLIVTSTTTETIPTTATTTTTTTTTDGTTTTVTVADVPSTETNGACKSGYRNDWGSCKDIDKCSQNLHVCRPTSEDCENMPGSYKCVCKADFTRDLRTGKCIQKRPTSELQPVTTELDHCRQGYRSSAGYSCTDIDECQEGIHNCSQTSQVCRNLDGSFSCECKPGFHLDQSSIRNRQCIEDGSEQTVAITTSTTTMLTDAVTSSSSSNNNNNNNNSSSSSTGNPRDKEATTASVPTVEEPVIESKVHSGYDRHPHASSSSYDVNNRFASGSVTFDSSKVYLHQCPSGYRFNSRSNTCEDIDECAYNIHNCVHSNLCDNTNGGYACRQCPLGDILSEDGICSTPKCYPGYVYSEKKRTCIDYNECLELRPCGTDEQCYNADGSYFCKCLQGNCEYRKGCIPGFQPSRVLIRHCEDINECSNTTLNTCSQNELCFNTFGSYYCSCKDGFHYETDVQTDDGRSRLQPAISGHCVDIDECKHYPDICPEGTKCENTVSSHRCQKKDDNNNMQSTSMTLCQNENPCQSNELCYTDGRIIECRQRSTSNKLPTCPPGFRPGRQHRTCEDIDECHENRHSCNEAEGCINVDGSFRCECKTGYKRTASNGQCEKESTIENAEDGNGDENDDDEDEQAKSRSTATTMATVTTSKKNMDNDSSEMRDCATGFLYDADTKTCVDIDECALGLHTCAAFSCNNTEGSFECLNCQLTADGLCKHIECRPGYEFDEQSNQCVDINECQHFRDRACSHGESCFNMDGAYYCQRCVRLQSEFRCYRRKQCYPGFEPSLRYEDECLDIDECAKQLHNCSYLETCINKYASFQCECRSGFYRDPATRQCVLKCDQDQLCPDYAYSEQRRDIEFTCQSGYQLARNSYVCLRDQQ